MSVFAFHDDHLLEIRGISYITARSPNQSIIKNNPDKTLKQIKTTKSDSLN